MIDEIKEKLGDNLLSVVKFGTEGQIENELYILEKIDFDILNIIRPIIVKNRKKSNIVPLFFTRNEIIDGADVFPLEFLDIITPHETIHGEHIVEKLRIDKRHVRRQLEFELRSKLIHLRENYIWIKNEKELQELVKSAVPTLMPLFYGLLYLKDVKAPNELAKLYLAVSENYKIDLSIFLEINELIKGVDKAKKEEYGGFVNKLIKVLENLIEIVDKVEL